LSAFLAFRPRASSHASVSSSSDSVSTTSANVKPVWEGIAQTLLDVAEVVETESEEDETLAWLDALGRNARKADSVEWLAKIQTDNAICAFDFEGRRYYRIDAMLMHVRVHRGTTITRPELSKRLARLGMVPVLIKRRFNDERLQVRAWSSG
ncbi:MAG: hypothetical protein WC655_14675, partial [Candidatus Hydrogenedentales bacterium]